jgi:trimethylamine:corrinoid methyltransferase-like protein
MNITAINTSKVEKLRAIANQATLAIFDLFALIAGVDRVHHEYGIDVVDPLSLANIKLKTDMLTQMLIQTGHIVHTTQSTEESTEETTMIVPNDSTPSENNVVNLFSPKK